MDRARAPWPIDIEAASGAAAGAVLWRRQGRPFVTLLLKASYKLVPEGTLAPAPPVPVLPADWYYGDDPRQSVRYASDLAPYLRRVDVLLTGHACAPPPGPVQTSSVRLTMYRDDTIVLDKALHVQGDRAQDPSGRWFGIVPFKRIPLVYERAAGSAEMNPVGIDPSRREPNLVHPRGWGLPACFGPVSRHWPARQRYLLGLDPRALEAPVLDLPDRLDDRYFQAAPEDQQLDALRGDEWIVIEGMHPTLPRLRTRLPSARGVARVLGEAPGSSRVVALRADTLSIDMDRERCSITFRAYLALASEQVVPALRVSVEVELPSVARPSPAALASTGPLPEPRVAHPLAKTVDLVLDDPPARPATPFEGPAAPITQALDLAPESIAPTTLPVPSAFAPASLPFASPPLPFASPPLPFASSPPPPPLLVAEPALLASDPEASGDDEKKVEIEGKVEGLGALFLGALPLPPLPPPRAARRIREDEAVAGVTPPRAR